MVPTMNLSILALGLASDCCQAFLPLRLPVSTDQNKHMKKRKPIYATPHLLALPFIMA